MQNSFINKITVSSRILILVLLICTLFIAKSIFLIISISILTLIISILTNKSVKLYFNSIKKSISWLLFIFIVYIIIYSSVSNAFIFIYKLILSIVLIKGFLFTVNFNTLNSGIYKILKGFKKLKLDIESISYNITIYIYFLKYLFDSSDRIKKLQNINGKRKYGIKYFLMPRLLNSINEVNNLENSLKLKYYNINEEKINVRSILLLVVFIILFITALFKEVIL